MRLPFILAALLSLVVGGCASSANSDRSGRPNSEPRPAVQKLFEKGNAYLRARNWSKAIETYRAALEKNSGRWKIWLNLGIAYSQAGRLREALDAIEKAIERGGHGRPRVYYNLGNIYQQHRRHPQALHAYRDALRFADEPDVEVLINTGATLLAMDRPKEAVEKYRRARELEPKNPRVLNGLARSLGRSGRHDKSLGVFDRVHSVAPDFPRAYFDRARLLGRLGRYPRAVEALETCLDKAPEGRLASRARSLLERYRRKTDSSSGE